MLPEVQPLQILRTEISSLYAALVALVPNLVAALIVLGFTAGVAFLLPRLTTRVMRRWRQRPALVTAARTVEKTLIWLLGLLVAATILFPNLTPSGLVAGLGLGSLVIGLAFRDIFENYLAGILILVRKPMRVGDDIECEGVSGRVEAITIRDTYLRKRSGELVLVPNAFIYKNPTMVLTDQPLRRITLTVGIAYDTDLARACAVLRGAFAGLETVDASKRVEVFVTSFEDSSIDLVLRWWAGSTPIEEIRSRDEVARAVKRALDAEGIVIPFPQRTLGFLEPVPVARARG
jgi:small conductance mechanosensitive channel